MRILVQLRHRYTFVQLRHVLIFIHLSSRFTSLCNSGTAPYFWCNSDTTLSCIHMCLLQLCNTFRCLCNFCSWSYLCNSGTYSVTHICATPARVQMLVQLLHACILVQLQHVLIFWATPAPIHMFVQPGTNKIANVNQLRHLFISMQLRRIFLFVQLRHLVACCVAPARIIFVQLRHIFTWLRDSSTDLFLFVFVWCSSAR